jgi:hypothetical protein
MTAQVEEPTFPLHRLVPGVVRALMTKHSKSPAQIYTAIGMAQGTWNRRMARKNPAPFTIDEIDKLAHYFGEPVTVFVTGIPGFLEPPSGRWGGTSIDWLTPLDAEAKAIAARSERRRPPSPRSARPAEPPATSRSRTPIAA